MNQEEYDRKYEFNRESSDNWVKKKAKNFGAVLTKHGFVKAVKRRTQIVNWVSSYSRSKMLIPDFIAGITVGIYNVPQAMSYATLAGLPPVYGLYASFFPPLLYSLFGTASHSSIGVFSITCLMVNKCVEDMMNGENADKFHDLTKIGIVTSLCILTGLIQAFMAIFRCDKLMKFLSVPAISAITFSACFFGVVTQIPKFCGFSVPSRNETYFGLFYQIYDIAVHIHKSNMVTVCVSVSALIFLVSSKILIDPIFENYDGALKGIPFPKELITIITAILASHFLNLEQNYGVKTLHTVPRGFPSPDIPRTDIWPYIFTDAFSIAIVAYAVTMAMGQIFARKHKYRIDSNQELLALGLINIGSSFFSVFPTSCSLSRTLVNERCGAKSQLSGIISSLVISLVILFIGPLLEPLPSCVLAAIVLVVVEPLLRKCTELPNLWRCSKHDFWIWICTAAVTLCTDIAQGVAAGILFAIITIAIQSQQPTIKQLGQVRENDFRPINHYATAKKTSFRIIRFDAPLIFANVEKFLDNVGDAIQETKKRRESTNSQEGRDWTAIILDCHTWTYTDSMGIAAVKDINEDLQRVHILPLFANLKSSLRRQYEQAELLEEEHVYEKDVVELEKKITSEEQRVDKKRVELLDYKKHLAKLHKMQEASTSDNIELGHSSEEAAQIEIKHGQEEQLLDLDEKRLALEKKILAHMKTRLAQQKKNIAKTKDAQKPKNVSVDKRIAQYQIYPSIQDALKSAHELVDKQQEFFAKHVPKE